MKLIIDIDEKYYDFIKYEFEHGSVYHPFRIIANGTPLKTGQWIDFGAIEPWFMCSECNERVFGGYKKYCSNCGAKMEVEEK